MREGTTTCNTQFSGISQGATCSLFYRHRVKIREKGASWGGWGVPRFCGGGGGGSPRFWGVIERKKKNYKFRGGGVWCFKNPKSGWREKECIHIPWVPKHFHARPSLLTIRYIIGVKDGGDADENWRGHLNQN